MDKVDQATFALLGKELRAVRAATKVLYDRLHDEDVDQVVIRAWEELREAEEWLSNKCARLVAERQ